MSNIPIIGQNGEKSDADKEKEAAEKVQERLVYTTLVHSFDPETKTEVIHCFGSSPDVIGAMFVIGKAISIQMDKNQTPAQVAVEYAKEIADWLTLQLWPKPKLEVTNEMPG